MLNANAIEKAVKGVFQLAIKINSQTVYIYIYLMENTKMILEYKLFVCKRISHIHHLEQKLKLDSNKWFVALPR
jgi:hypothetical protein